MRNVKLPTRFPDDFLSSTFEHRKVLEIRADLRALRALHDYRGVAQST